MICNMTMIEKKKLHPEEPEALHLPFKKLAQNDSIYSAIKNMNNSPFHSKFAFSSQWASLMLLEGCNISKNLNANSEKNHDDWNSEIEHYWEICWPLRDFVPNSYLMFNHSHGMCMALECYTNWVSRKNSNCSIATKTATLSFWY